MGKTGYKPIREHLSLKMGLKTKLGGNQELRIPNEKIVTANIVETPALVNKS